MELKPGTQVGRFVIGEKLGSGGQGTTYEAVDHEIGYKVAVKALAVSDADGWKSIELFEREARVLEQIQHSNVPEFIEFIHEDERFFLVQELIEGESLDASLRRGVRFETDDLLSIAQALLEVLEYLHGLNPPVIHRDIKPQNVLLADDGKISLVDFGAVQATLAKTYASTMVGTYGYMAPEQYQGQADGRSDLYALGATLVYLLTGAEPHELPKKRLKLDYRSDRQLEGPFIDWLDRLIEPAPEDRFQSATIALAQLPTLETIYDTDPATELPSVFGLDDEPSHPEGDEPPAATFAEVFEPEELAGLLRDDALPVYSVFEGPEETALMDWPAPPTGSNIELSTFVSAYAVGADDLSLRILIPTASSKELAFWFVFMTLFTTLWFAFLIFWTSAIQVAAFSIPFWLVGFYLAFSTLKLAFGSEEAMISSRGLHLQRSLFGISYRTINTGPIDRAELRTNRNPQRGQISTTGVALDCGVKTHWLGTRLSDLEKQWLADVLSEYLRGATGGKTEMDFDRGKDGSPKELERQRELEEEFFKG